MKHAALAVLCCAVFASCSKSANSPTAPSTVSGNLQPAPSTIYYLHMVSSGIEEVGRNSFGRWLYKVTTLVRNQSGVGLTVTAYEAQVITGSTVVASGNSAPYLLVPAYANQNLTLSISSATRLQVGTLTWNVHVGYRDKYGNTGSVSGQFTDNPCYGCWDYSVGHVSP
jgi:hypothetical protein